jgi:imidazolonepropionase-like amidohydrolase
MRLIFTDANVIDLEAEDVRTGQTIVVEDGRIVDLTRSAGRGEVTSLERGFVLPGLIDAHVHLVWEGQADPNRYTLQDSVPLTAYRAARSALRSLRAGVTTVRDLGGPHGIPVAVAAAIAEEIIPGARVVAAGSPIVQTGGHVYTMSHEVDGPDEVRKAARQEIKFGAHLIKVMASGGAYTKGESIRATQLTLPEIRAAVEEAHAAERRVAAHALPERAIQNALDAGVDTVEHAALLSDDNVAAFRSTQAFMIPTLAPYYLMGTRGAASGVPDYAVAKSKEVMEYYPRSLRKASAAGIQMGLGTDAGSPQIPHPGVPFEAWLWKAEAGIPTAAILRAATRGAAHALGLAHEIGAIAPGLWADFVVYERNPLEDITALHFPKAVYQAGLQVAGASVVWSSSLLGLT